jgi:hypothetical protein
LIRTAQPSFKRKTNSQGVSLPQQFVGGFGAGGILEVVDASTGQAWRYDKKI